jgi:hypothetical protein
MPNNENDDCLCCPNVFDAVQMCLTHAMGIQFETAETADTVKRVKCLDTAANS